MYELFTDSDGFLSILGDREMQDFYDVNGAVSHTLQFSLHETCLRLGQKRVFSMDTHQTKSSSMT